MKIIWLAIVIFLKVTAVAQAKVIDKIVAIVDSEVITQSDVDKALAPLSAQYAAIYRDEEFSQKLAEAKRDIINRLIENKLILMEAEKQEIRVSDEKVEAKIEEIRAQFSSEDEFEATLLKQGLSIVELEENYRNQIMIQRVINREVRSKIVVKPTEIVDYYYAHLDDFTNPEEIKISHILIRIDNTTDAHRAYQAAREVLGLLDKGIDFAQVAREYSDGPHADQGGSVGFVSQGQMIKEIDEVIFKLKVGELSGLIKSDLGYHIVRIDDKRPLYVRGLSDVQFEIKDILFKRKMEENFTEWINKLKEDAFISIKKD